MEYKAFNSPIGKRLKDEMKQQGLTATELSRRAGVLSSFIYDVISGKSQNPSTLKLSLVADALGIELRSLVDENVQSIRENKLCGQYVEIPSISVTFSEGDGKVVSQSNTVGKYQFNKRWIEEELGVKSENLRAFVLNNDNMQPTLCVGDFVLVDTGYKHPRSPAIFLLFDGVWFTIKRCEYIEGSSKIRLTSDNQQYPSYEKSNDELVIVGRVVWFSRKI